MLSNQSIGILEFIHNSENYNNFYMNNSLKKKIVSALIQINQNDNMTPSIKSEEPDKFIGEQVNQKFKNIKAKWEAKAAQNAIQNLYYRHNVVEYKKQFNFYQNWEECKGKDQENNQYSILKNENWILNCLYFTIFVLYGLSLWLLSIYRIFSMQTTLYPVFTFGIFVQVLDGYMNYFLLRKDTDDRQFKFMAQLRTFLSITSMNLTFSAYLLILIIQEFFDNSSWEFFLIGDLIFVYLGYLRFLKMFEVIKIRMLSSPFRNQIQIVQLISGCLFRVHLFSLIIYSVSKIDSDQNWTQNITNFEKSWITRYIYSLYFTCTTMFTVGYGDITPKNLYQIVTILFVQVVGIINIGYIINEVGRFMAKINQDQQILFKNISEAEQIATSFNLPDDLSSKIRNHIVQNSLNRGKMNLQEQQAFMSKINDELRQDIKTYNQTNIVKSSIFFLCHWSIKFQRRVADRLIKAVFSPDQTLPQLPGRQRLYILAQGKLDIEIFEQFNNSQCLKKVIRSIKVNQGFHVQNNIYGYSSMISGLKMKMRGVVKEYTTCYILSKEDLLTIIKQDEKDFGYFHQIKNRIELSKIKTMWEAPQIVNSKEHYNPNCFYIIRKFKKQQSHHLNKRKGYSRRHTKKCKLQYEQVLSTDQNLSYQQYKQQTISQKHHSSKLIQIYEMTNTKKITSSFSFKQLNHDQLKKNMLMKFEQLKIYQSFCQKFNFNNILSLLHKLNGRKAKNQLTMTFQIDTNNSQKFQSNKSTLQKILYKKKPYGWEQNA